MAFYDSTVDQYTSRKQLEPVRGNHVGAFQNKRALMKEQLQNPPFNFPPGLAHVVASVAEPRSDVSDPDPLVNAIVTKHRGQLLNKLQEILPDASTGEVSLRTYGGLVEHVVEEVAGLLRAAAEEHDASEIVQRLDRLPQERRLGVSSEEGSDVASWLEIDLDALPRSTTSGRRVGVWR